MKPALYVAILLLISATASANEAEEQWWGLTLDNDLILGDDGGYTNGFYASYIAVKDKPYRQQQKPWYMAMQYALLGEMKASDSDLIEVYNLGHTMVTPDDIGRNPPDPDDVPYAGLLSWQGSVMYASDYESRLSTLVIGLVGPASGAEGLQKLVHKLTGSETPRGWHHQLNNELVFELSQQRSWRIPLTHGTEFSSDLISSVSASLGTLRSGVGGAAFLRMGKNLDGSFATFGLSENRQLNPMASPGSYYFYIGGQYSYDFNNIFFNGNSFRDSPSAELKHGSSSLIAGLAWTWQDIGFALGVSDGEAFSDSSQHPSFASLSVIRKF